MDTSAVVMFIVGGALLWGGLAVSVWRAMRTSKRGS